MFPDTHFDITLHLTNVLLPSAPCLFILTHAFKASGPDIPWPGILKRNVNFGMYYVHIPTDMISESAEGTWLSKLFVSLFIVSTAHSTVSACQGSEQQLL